VRQLIPKTCESATSGIMIHSAGFLFSRNHKR
jgi:hypothetical protein